jgi:hypothetical protein
MTHDDAGKLFALAHQDNVAPATLLAALVADPATARLLAAWRKSVHDLEAARAAAEAAGEDTAWFNIHVGAANDRDAE